ncbi:MAG: outer membrane lipoprotein carrier protein LolA [Bacteroidales bacterium]|nr:outer membrane lipoprotein carrier protein LolA [Bacteroidales bacterium]MBR6266636.1 outer membrane lipoprotein carrier protein LolA [Bacteroidales bacterium]
MKKIISVLSMLTICSAVVFGQNTKNAKEILDKVSQKTKSYSTINLTYSLVHTSPDGANDKTTGTMLMKGKKYKLSILDNVLYCDGTTLWTHMVEEKEVVVSKADNDDSGMLNPSTVLTMYEKGFKYKFIQDRFEGSRAIYVIDLYPENVEKSEYSKVRLSIDKDKSQLWKAEYFAKDGNKYTITVNTFKVNEQIPDASFVFDKAKNPGVKVIDER